MIRKPSSRRFTAFLTFCTIVSCITISFCHIVDASYIASIPAYEEECYIIGPQGENGGILHGHFEYLNDQLSVEPVSVVIIDIKEEHVLYRSRRRAKDGSFSISIKPDQKVNLCLQNGLVTAGRGKKSISSRKHDGENRVFGFDYEVKARDVNSEIHSVNEKNTKAAYELQRALTNLINHHSYMRTRETKHREVVEGTFSQLMWWVGIEGVTVVAIAGLQILYLRNFLERRRYL